MSEVTLYAKDNLGRIRQWTIRACPDGLEIEHGVLGGSMQLQFEEVLVGKSVRTAEEQIMLQMASRILRKRDAGYMLKLEDAQKDMRTNALGLRRPMLAKTYEHPSKIKDGAVWQYKYNGLRCLMKKTVSGVVAYSRNGKLLTSIDHITNVIEDHMEDGDTFDGELYAHGQTLQTISSWIKRKQPETKNIRYHIYDMIDDVAYQYRYNTLQERLQGSDGLPFTLVPTRTLSDDRGRFREAVRDALKEARALGYEGVMIRHGGTVYEDGKRSGSLLKVKVWLDEEYEIIAVHESKDGWGILECRLPTGGSFSVSAPGSIASKMEVLRHPQQYIGKWVTVQFAELTKDGVPFHPVATMYRLKDSE